MAYWAVARILVRHESLAAEQLKCAGFEVFAPKTKTGNTPLLCSPATCSFASSTIGAPSTAPSVSAVWSSSATPRRSARRPRSPDGKARLTPRPRPASARSAQARSAQAIPIGAKVKIAGGPFRGFTGIYAGQTARERERILIDLLGRKAPVELLRGQLAERDDLAKTRVRAKRSPVARQSKCPRKQLPRRAERFPDARDDRQSRADLALARMVRLAALEEARPPSAEDRAAMRRLSQERANHAGDYR